MDYYKLHEILNGFHMNPSTRNEIVGYIKTNGKIGVFAYASLISNPIKPFDEDIHNCILRNYRKGFFCEDVIYRGTTDLPGLTMGLKKESDATVNGIMLIANSDRIIPFLDSFFKRESPVCSNGTIMDIYTFEFVRIQMPDEIHFEYALTCVVNTESKYYLTKELSYDEQAKIIGRTYGIYGTNLGYLKKIKIIYNDLRIKDSFTHDFEDLYDKTLNCRRSLPFLTQKWLDLYDQKQTLVQKLNKLLIRLSLLPSRKQFSLLQSIFETIKETISCG